MTVAGSVHNHPGWLGLWPLAEPDNSELSGFYPPLKSDREKERGRTKLGVRGRDTDNYYKGRGSRSQKYGLKRRMRTERKRKKAWRHTWRGGGSCCATHPGGTDIRRRKAKKAEGGGKKYVASDIVKKHLTFTWFYSVQLKQSSKGQQSFFSATRVLPFYWSHSIFIMAENSLYNILSSSINEEDENFFFVRKNKNQFKSNSYNMQILCRWNERDNRRVFYDRC